MTDREIMRQALGAIKAAHRSHIEFDYRPNQNYMLEIIGKLEAALAQPEIPMAPEHLPQYIATNNIKPTTEGGGGAGGET